MGPTSVTSRPDGFAQGEIVLLATTSGDGPTLKRKGVRVRSFLNGQEFEKGDAMLVVKNPMLGIKIALLRWVEYAQGSTNRRRQYSDVDDSQHGSQSVVYYAVRVLKDIPKTKVIIRIRLRVGNISRKTALGHSTVLMATSRV